MKVKDQVLAKKILKEVHKKKTLGAEEEAGGVSTVSEDMEGGA